MIGAAIGAFAYGASPFWSLVLPATMDDDFKNATVPDRPPVVRTAQAQFPLSKAEFEVRFCARFADPKFRLHRDAIEELLEIAWDGYREARKRAHGIMILTPVYWYQAPSALKLMIDRLCADGGNPDPSSIHGKKPEEAKSLELAGWPYPRHLAGRSYSVVVHGDTAGVETLRRSLSDWLNDIGLVQAGARSCIDRYIDYYGPYATSHQALDRDIAMQEEVRNAARALASHVKQRRAGLKTPDETLSEPRPK
jgi:multimeric flavodoxin WrbA